MPVMDQEARQWGMFCHLAGFAHYFVPFGSILGPLIVWMIKKDTSPFVDAEGREALNFQLSMLIFEIISVILIIVIVGIFLLAAIEIFKIVIMIVAAVKANSGEGYRYPMTFRFL